MRPLFSRGRRTSHPDPDASATHTVEVFTRPHHERWDEAAAMVRVDHDLQRLRDAGALDAHTVDVCDAWIEAELHQQLHRIDQASLQFLDLLRAAEADALAQVARTTEAVGFSRYDLDRAQDVEHRFTVTVSGDGGLHRRIREGETVVDVRGLPAVVRRPRDPADSTGTDLTLADLQHPDGPRSGRGPGGS